MEGYLSCWHILCRCRRHCGTRTSWRPHPDATPSFRLPLRRTGTPVVGEAESRGKASGRLGDEITSHQPRRSAFIANKSPPPGRGSTVESRLLPRQARILLSPRKRWVSVPGSVDIRPRLKDWRAGLAPVVGRPRPKRQFPRSHGSLAAPGERPVDTADSCEVRAARLGDTQRSTLVVGTSVIADSLCSEGLPERLGSSENRLFQTAVIDVVISNYFASLPHVASW